jgi:hypothetical protein
MGVFEQAALLMEEQIRDDIAMDVVGSVNVGMSEGNPDIDLVL